MQRRHASNHGRGEPIETSQNWLYTAFTNERAAAKPGRHTHRTSVHASLFAVPADRVNGAGTRRDAHAGGLPIGLGHLPVTDRVRADAAGFPGGAAARCYSAHSEPRPP